MADIMRMRKLLIKIELKFSYTGKYVPYSTYERLFTHLCILFSLTDEVSAPGDGLCPSIASRK